MTRRPHEDGTAPSADRDRAVSADDGPELTVVVPVYNDPGGVRTTLASLVDQTVPPARYEVIVVDNGSTDGTRDAVRAFVDEHPQVRLRVERAVQSSYAARNEGIEAARAPLLGFVDADMTVPETYVADVLDAADRGHRHFGCAVDLYGGEVSAAGVFDTVYGFDVPRCVERAEFVPTCCLVAGREVFDAVGGFDERLVSGGDFEWGSRAAAAGYPPAYAPGIVLRHPARTGLRSVLKKHARVGRGYTDLRRLFPERAVVSSLRDPRNLLPPHPGDYVSRVRQAAPSLDSPPRYRFLVAYVVAYLARLAEVWGRAAAARERPPERTGPAADLTTDGGDGAEDRGGEADGAPSGA